MSELAKWINELAGDYVEDWVGHQLAEAWQEDKDKIAELEAERDALREAIREQIDGYRDDGMFDDLYLEAILEGSKP